MSVDIRDLKNLVFLPAYDPADDEDGFEIGDYDRHALNRLRLICQLRDKWCVDDEALIRFVVEQEIIAREHDVLDGIGETLELGAFLLAHFRRPTDVSLYIRAKTVNFDAGCGFDSEYAYWVMGEEPWSHVENTHPELAKRWAKFGYEPPESLEAWWAGREAYFAEGDELSR